MSTYAVQRLRAVGVADAVAQRIAPLLTVSSVAVGQCLGSGDISCAAWRHIIDGIVAVVATTAKGVTEAQNIYGPGTWFGEQEIINADTSQMGYVCVTNVELLSMPAATFLQLLDSEPGFLRYLTRLTAWRAQRNAETLILMKAGNPCLRTVLGLGMFFEALAAKSSRPVTNTLAESITIPVRQGVLAQLCGVSRSSFWENVSRLVEAGWLKSSYGKLELLNLPTWRTVMRRRRECTAAKMDPTIDELLNEFSSADMAYSSPVHMYS